ncbi:nodulation protein noeI [Candidatus Rhodobacter oscarellae]|uniref:Nodulation protein noeI n=1 Tax=Candidatus Rhodobacter oscarellae TaxID=1675527 RepID=A0A0J9E207_9RHOB|nr:FkbM family methyltransferase [Candidatus Rhodobacter lobularis]KMW56760.1 nodulation protein noeI [Candidatus Rhodobacter lobularis]
MAGAGDSAQERAESKARQRAHHQRRKEQARGLMRGVISQIGPGDLVVDCGANVGAVAVPLARTGAELHAFEPDPVAFTQLQKATAAFDNVHLHAAAVGIAEGTARLFRGDTFADDPVKATRRSTVLAGGVRMSDGGDSIETPVIDLPARLTEWAKRDRGIAFLKLDIEGAELDLLTEMLRLDLFSQIRLTVAEMHAYKFPHLRPEFQALRKTITARYPDTRVWLDWI